ncbi:MAG: hypothetical protein ACD_5C00081G0002 [uncultured bacterium]|nr:MAG: hypothetical protein ACD_5C00081G0002 [uncultured bacterium]KKQ44306.1 MAG: hypothetical protein US63_C0029G0013 [Candidatus Moranbacteria bacterium GW2011_GWC2_37_8]KKQ60876.1 MAG: protein of unknown function with transmembrane region [Parcubacteria group bacterium GW2011_GWC1_38_22]KKQ81336.1 MAG: hypothetical protein UT03_C0005G0011 [Candidatus Moranbacteria bacterium GW2011_GWD2_38_7]
MKKKVVYFLIFIVIAIFQLSFIPVIFEKKAVADAVLMAILAWSILDGFFAFLAWAIFFGLFYDIISYSVIGTHALIFLVVVYFVSFFSRRFSVEMKGFGTILFLLFILVATLASNATIATIFVWKMQNFHGFWQSFGSLKTVMIQLVYNTFLFLILFMLIRKIKQFFAIEV